MACAGAITATVLTAGAGMVGDVGGEVLKSTSGITNQIKDAATGLTGDVSMASFTGNQAAFQSLASPTALTNTLSKVATLSPALQSSFTNMASGLGDNVFSGGFDVTSNQSKTLNINEAVVYNHNKAIFDSPQFNLINNNSIYYKKSSKWINNDKEKSTEIVQKELLKKFISNDKKIK